MSKIFVSVCMGSSCYPRGNRETVVLLKQRIKEQGWEDRVNLRGNLCEGLCKDGPVLRIDGDIFHPASPQAAVELLERHLQEKP